MSYSDAPYNSPIALGLDAVATVTFAATASGSLATATPASQVITAPFALTPTHVSLAVQTAPATTCTGITAYVMDGTSTIASATLGTLTAGEGSTGSITSGAAIASGDVLQVVLVGTSTTSAAASAGQAKVTLVCNRAFS